MAVGNMRRVVALAAGVFWLAAALAQDPPPRVQPPPGQPVYKCVSANGSVSYSHVPCPGARELGAQSPKPPARYAKPPQDRAVRMKRAQLSPDDRAECSNLDNRLREQARQLEVAFDREVDIQQVKDKLRFRELRC